MFRVNNIKYFERTTQGAVRHHTKFPILNREPYCTEAVGFSILGCI